MPDRVLDPPVVTPPAGRDDTARPHRAPWAAVALLVGGVAATILWLAAPGLALRMAPVALAFEGGAPATVVDGLEGPQGAYVVGYEHDGYLEVELTLRNTGLVGVTVEDVTPVMQDMPLLALAEPADAVAVPAGAAATTRLRFRFDHCEAYHEREAMLVHHLEVRARVLGREVVERVALDRVLMARSPMLWQCPDRTIDRSDDLRAPGRG